MKAPCCVFIIIISNLFNNNLVVRWVECVGCADRSAYDLTQHTMATGVKLCAEKRLPEPVTRDIMEIMPNKVGGWEVMMV